MTRVRCKRSPKYGLAGLVTGVTLLAGWQRCTAEIASATVESKPSAGKAADAGAPKVPTAEKKDISTTEQLEFQQAKISAEMAELEQRMFRLSETLKPLEPENSSRLMLGVKLAREELILHQMKEIQKQLHIASLAESVIEQKQLLAKLERLEQLLLSADLDFQMRLEQLRQIREALRRLDVVIREEDRERKALADTQAEAEKLKAEPKADTFSTIAKDQAQNRESNEGITEMVRGLGSTGAEALAELIKATGNMSQAEGYLAKLEVPSAGKEQEMALASLKYAREKLVAEAQRLKEQLRAEVKKRTVEGLALMLEQQIMVREATESLSKRAGQGSRQALASVAGLANSEAKIVALADDLITLVEETEFGIALPAAIHVVRDQMEAVQVSLRKSEAGTNVIAAEKQIEADLEGLLDAMKQMPATGKGQAGNGGNQEERDRELNRMIAELKMIRLLETRVHQDTATADRGRESAPVATPAVRKQVESLTGRQEDVRDVTESLANERSLDEP